MRKAKIAKQQNRYVKTRLKPQPKQNTAAWQKRNEARSVLQEQYRKRQDEDAVKQAAAQSFSARMAAARAEKKRRAAEAVKQAEANNAGSEPASL